MGFRNEHTNNLAQTLCEKHISIGRFVRSKLNEYSDQVDIYTKLIKCCFAVVLRCFDYSRAVI